MIFSHTAHCQELIADFKDESLPVLNEELRKSGEDLDALESRVDTVEASVTHTASNALSGSVIQSVTVLLTTPVDVDSVITVDDSPPLYSEGEVMGSSGAFTPKLSTSTIVVRASFWGGLNANASFGYWINDATSSDEAKGIRFDNGAASTTAHITGYTETSYAATSTTARTYYLVGAVESGTFYLGRLAAGTDVFGAADFGSITVQEIKA